MKLTIKVIPSSSRDCITGWLGDTLKIKVKAPPEKGKANKAVIHVLEKHLSLPRGSIEISSGTASCRKVVTITCKNEAQIMQQLTAIHNK